MDEQKPHPRLLMVWRIRLLVGAFLPSLVCGMLFRGSPLWWGLSTLVWATVLLFFYYGYFPILYRRTGWKLEDGWLTLHTGVLFERYRTVPVENIQHLSRRSLPLMRLFRLTTLTAHCAGGALMLPGMDLPQADLLQAQLTQKGGMRP